jgi:hypothetical protein
VSTLDGYTVFFFLTVYIGYGRLGGSKASAQDLLEIFQSMEQNGLLHPTRLLTGEFIYSIGYLMTAQTLQVIFRGPRVCLLCPLSPDSSETRNLILFTLWTVRVAIFLLARLLILDVTPFSGHWRWRPALCCPKRCPYLSIYVTACDYYHPKLF